MYLYLPLDGECIVFNSFSILSELSFKVFNFVNRDTYNDNNSLILFIFLILIIFSHKKNITNLKNKKESKIKL